MPILRIENPRAMLTAANIRLESGCEDKYLSLHRPPPNPYLLGGAVGGKDYHILSKSRGRIFVIAGSSFAPNPYCWDRRRKIITFALPHIKKVLNLWSTRWRCYVDFVTGWLFWRVDVFFCDHVYSIILVTPGSPPAFVPGNASDPLLPRPPHPSPNIPHYFLLLVCSISSFSPHTRSDSQSSWVRLIVRISYSWDMYELGKVRHEPDKCIITIWPQLYPQPKA